MKPTGVAVILLNYRGAADTLACVDSLFASTVPIARLFIADNGSPDASLNRLRDGLAERRSAYQAVWLNRWKQNAPFSVSETTQARIRSGETTASQVVLIDNQENRGFAAGNNVAMRMALACPNVDYVWLLNNDTVVDSSALEELVQAALN